MRRLLVLCFAATAASAHAEGEPCRQSVFHPVSCKSAPEPASDQPSRSAGETSAATERAPEARLTSAQQPAPPQQPARPQQTASVKHELSAANLAIDPRPFEPYACNFAEKFTLGAPTCQARQVAQSHRIIGSLIHEGHCEQAAKAALATGDDAYASRVRAICADQKH
jgi:hypothetical protein